MSLHECSEGNRNTKNLSTARRYFQENKDIDSINNADTESLSAPRRQCCSQRWIMAYMGVWLGFVLYLLSMNMSVTIVCMTKPDHSPTTETKVVYGGHESTGMHNVTEDMHDKDNESLKGSNYVFNNTTEMTTSYSDVTNEPSTVGEHHDGLYSDMAANTGEFTWDKKTQSFILSGYFYSYTVVQIPGGWLGSKFGGRRVIGICMSMACLMTLLTPEMARVSAYLVVVARILLGMSLGVAVPTFYGLVGAWALPTERSRMTGLIYIGETVGAIVAYSTSGFLCVHGFDNGWASVFYIHGMFGVLFVANWWYFVYNSPNEHPRITEAERLLILKNTKRQDGNIKTPPIPWKHIFTYFPLYISYIAHICDTWTFYLLLTCLPQYLKEVLHFDIQSNGLLSSLPLVTNVIGIGIAGAGADFVRSRNVFTITTIRKMFLITGFVGVGSFMLVPGFLTSEHRGIAIMCICFCTMFMALAAVGGYSTNALDIAPKYSSLLFGISNMLASIPGAIAPLIVAIITKNQTIEEWRIVFFVSTGVSVFACVVYGLFANIEPAKWGDIREDIEIEVDIPLKTDVASAVKPGINI